MFCENNFNEIISQYLLWFVDFCSSLTSKNFVKSPARLFLWSPRPCWPRSSSWMSRLVPSCTGTPQTITYHTCAVCSLLDQLQTSKTHVINSYLFSVSKSLSLLVRCKGRRQIQNTFFGPFQWEIHVGSSASPPSSDGMSWSKMLSVKGSNMYLAPKKISTFSKNINQFI